MLLSIIQNEYHRRMIEEGLARITYCLSELSEEEIWYRNNANCNSIGNIIMHLEGNVRQYILAGIGVHKDTRTRDMEFDNKNRLNYKALLEKLSNTLHDSYEIIKNLSIENLTENRKVQGFNETVLSIIIHVIEHFSYHVGQITFYTKSTKDIDTKYYDGLDLNAS